jgi:hypothetical protein
MPSTDERRVPLDEAYRAATGHEPPPPLTPEQQREFDTKLAKAWQDARRIYGDETLGPAAVA